LLKKVNNIIKSVEKLIKALDSLDMESHKWATEAVFANDAVVTIFFKVSMGCFLATVGSKVNKIIVIRIKITDHIVSKINE
jgi:hypothetical protein